MGYSIDSINTLAGTSYPYDILALNALCIAQGGTGGHTYSIDALNELCTLLGITAGHTYIIDALNTIVTAIGGTGTYTYEDTAWQEIAGIGLGTLLIDLDRNTDLVPTNSIKSVSTGVGVFSAIASPGDWVFTKHKTERIRQSGSIERIILTQIQDITNIAAFKLNIWRKDGSTYDKLHTVDLLPLVTEGNNTINLVSALDVLEGDYYGYHLQRAAAPNVNFLAATAQTNGSSYVTGSTPTDTDFNWDTEATGSSAYVAVSHLCMKAPLCVAVGDSIIESYPDHTSFVDAGYSAVDIAKSWQYKAKAANAKFIYQNCGVGGNTTTQIVARFTAQVVNAKPKIAIINGGVNDIAGGVISKATFLANWTTILDACEANNIYALIWKMMPWTNGTNTNMGIRDEWNADLVALAATYENVYVIDWDTLLGKFRSGGAANNLWDIKTEYNQDGVHFNEAGQQIIATEIIRVLSTSTNG